MHWIEMMIGAETDTSEIINEMIESVRNYGRVGITGVYVGYVSDLGHDVSLEPATNARCRPTTLMSARSWNAGSDSLEMVRPRCINTGNAY